MSKTVKDCMNRRHEFVPPETTLQDAARLMRERDFGFLPVGKADRLIGVLTDRDIVTRAVAEGWDLSTRKVEEVMTDSVWYCFEDETVENASESMCNQQVRRLIVLNSDKRMTGILSLHDIAEATNDERLCGHIIDEVTETRRAA